MTSSLVLTALGADQPGLISKLSQVISDSNCNIEDSRMSVLGGEFAILMQITGNWDKLSKLETTLEKLQESTGLQIVTKRTDGRLNERGKIPYSIEVVSIDHPGIVHQLAEFFSTRAINIYDMTTHAQAAAHTGTPIFTLNMTVEIPAGTHIASLRDEFIDFCEQLNLDAVLEPYKI
ncbi:MAG: glycine cleavage system protein R [Gammaproteobacteria bacterium]|nr:glycine cleavage system protein R [Gammaproteobacteria bacterium]